MKKNMVKTLALAGMAVLTMGALAGCGSNTSRLKSIEKKLKVQWRKRK